MLKLVAYWRLARPLQLLAVAAVALTGMVMAVSDGAILDVGIAIGHLGVLLLVAASIHYANEYADVETDQLTVRTPFSGGSGVLALGEIHRESVLNIALVLLLMAIVLYGWGFMIGASHGWAGVVLLSGAGLGWMYSLPPLQLAWRGYGEITNAFLGGLWLMMYGYLSLNPTIRIEVVSYTVPFTILVFLNLLATTWADREADYAVGKMTLAAQLPMPNLRRIFMLGVLLYSITLLLLVSMTLILLLHLPSLPMLIYSYRRYTRWHSPHPMVYTMITALVGQGLGWLIMAVG
jgi:1,4-dihydroxy-2-naphthoate octaprenyltransferase